MKISIALCTYNGEKFLREQLDSIARQTVLPDELVVCDDRSGDGTLEILAEFKSQAPFAVHIHRNDNNLGPVKNFDKAISLGRGDYICLCDQDDVWFLDKLEVTLSAMREMEQVYGSATPLLVHTDLRVVDEQLQVLGDSLWGYIGSEPARLKSLNRVLMQNFATGCTVMINRSLRDLALPVPSEARMHDWWLALVATAFGRVSAVPRATMLYRQHGRNESGAFHWKFMKEIFGFFDHKQGKAAIIRRDALLTNMEQQAAVFAERYSSRLDLETRKMLSEFCTLRQKGFFMRRYLTLRHGFLYSNRLANLGMLLFR